MLGAALARSASASTGAFLGTPLSLMAMTACCELRRCVPATAGVGGTAPTPAAPAPRAGCATTSPARPRRSPGSLIVALLQNVDIIAGKHRFSTDVASSYGATAVAAKVLVWVAMGAGFYLVPETSRRHAAGRGHAAACCCARSRSCSSCALPVLVIFAFGGTQLLQAAFGADRLLAVDALLPLGVAFTLLALTYLAIQYLLALRRTRSCCRSARRARRAGAAADGRAGEPGRLRAVVLGVQAIAARASRWRSRSRGRAPRRDGLARGRAGRRSARGSGSSAAPSGRAGAAGVELGAAPARRRAGNASSGSISGPARRASGCGGGLAPAAREPREVLAQRLEHRAACRAPRPGGRAGRAAPRGGRSRAPPAGRAGA